MTKPQPSEEFLKHTEALIVLLKLQQPKEEDKEVDIISNIDPKQIQSSKELPAGAESSSP